MLMEKGTDRAQPGRRSVHEPPQRHSQAREPARRHAGAPGCHADYGSRAARYDCNGATGSAPRVAGSASARQRAMSRATSGLASTSATPQSRAR